MTTMILTSTNIAFEWSEVTGMSVRISGSIPHLATQVLLNQREKDTLYLLMKANEQRIMSLIDKLPDYKQLAENHAECVVDEQWDAHHCGDIIVSCTIDDYQVFRAYDKDAKPLRMAGFPHHALDVFLPKLIRAGHRVAICDLLEDPSKKLVKRDS